MKSVDDLLVLVGDIGDVGRPGDVRIAATRPGANGVLTYYDNIAEGVAAYDALIAGR